MKTERLNVSWAMLMWSDTSSLFSFFPFTSITDKATQNYFQCPSLLIQFLEKPI